MGAHTEAGVYSHQDNQAYGDDDKQHKKFHLINRLYSIICMKIFLMQEE